MFQPTQVLARDEATTQPERPTPSPEHETKPSPQGKDSPKPQPSPAGEPRPHATPARQRPPHPPEQNLPAGTRVDRYIVLSLLGAGGMGVVYLAYDPELDRKVALKLLHSAKQAPSATGQARLLREAQAMARISHRNVCAIFDTGTVDDQVFIAMEYIAGTSLHAWEKQAKNRSWQEALAPYLEAGRGLQAAHQAGLIHRDFKPANVLRGEDGRVCVTDFGLARLAPPPRDDTPQAARPERDAGATPSSGTMLEQDLTRSGVVMGTPRYMSPEQHQGGVSDARSDQFSFCAALYAALYGQHPFSAMELAQFAQKHAGRKLSARGSGEGTQPLETPDPHAWQAIVRGPPRNARVPAWIRRALMRGLSLRPEDRHPSMAALLEQLGQGPRRARRRWIAAGATLCLLAVSGAVTAVHAQTRACADAGEQIAQDWNPELRQRLEAAFLATGKPFAPEAAKWVAVLFDRYAGAWKEQQAQACVAARVRGSQPESLYSLRVLCLERRRKEFRALAQVLTQVTPEQVSRASDAVLSLPSLRECEDVESLSREVAAPNAPAVHAKLEQLQTRLAEANALYRVARYKEALSQMKALEPEVTQLSYLPLASALHRGMGFTLRRLGDAEGAAAQLEQALYQAEAARADRGVIEALNQLVYIRGTQGRAEPMERWAKLAEAVLTRIGGDPALEIALKGNLSALPVQQSRYADAWRLLQEAREIQRRTPALEGSEQAVRLSYNLGAMAQMVGDRPRAIAFFQEALEGMSKVLGARHPDVAECHYMLAWTLRESGEPEEGLRHAVEALEIRRGVFGDEHLAVAQALEAFGMSLISLKRYPEAEESFQRALAIKLKREGPASPELAYSYDGMGQALLASGQPARAVEPLRKALSFEDAEPELLAESGFALAQALWASGEREGARSEAALARKRFSVGGNPENLAKVDAWLKSHPGLGGKGPSAGHAR